MKKIESFGLVAFKNSDAVHDAVLKIAAWASRTGIPVYFHPFLGKFIDVPSAEDEQSFLDKSEAIISLGGDGTFLSVSHLCRFTEKPIIGVNLGDLGFLTDIGADALEENLMKMHSGNYRTISRMVLEARLVRNKEVIKTFHALNDVFVNRVGTPKLTSISAWSGDDFIADFYADGIIVATPNGSTAYSLSAGGPIVEPTVQAFILTPICPHSLTERPIVLPSSNTISLHINENNPELLLSIDGMESVLLETGDRIVISYGGTSCNLIQLAERSYFSLLRRKLEWGRGLKRQSARPA